jgi:glycerol-3-phosphate dehydrogenase subunit C
VPGSPESLGRSVMATCINCDQCRELMEEAPCQYFPRLYVLADRAAAGGEPISDLDVKELMDYCNACGQCPCRAIQTDIRKAKDAFVTRDGLPAAVRLIEDVQLVGRLCGTFPTLTNMVLAAPVIGRLAKRALGVHPDRKTPTFPKDRLARYVARRGLDRRPEGQGRKVAYFVGCTARYMFPSVAKATVEVLEANGIKVFVPEQKCCGMPPYLEGDRPKALKLAEGNLPILEQCIEEGFDIVTACPTCSFMFKSVLARSAQFAPGYRDRVRASAIAGDGATETISARLRQEIAAPTGRTNHTAAEFTKPWVVNHNLGLHADHDTTDIGYFAHLDPNQRIKVASHVFELGEYLRDLADEGQLRLPQGFTGENLAYFAPCHLREQEMGRPWLELMGTMPGASVTSVGLSMDCCGLGGIQGFKQGFHDTSIAMGQGIVHRIEQANPERVTTECLGCRLQFNQMQDRPVSHPVELLAEAYRKAAGAPS